MPQVRIANLIRLTIREITPPKDTFSWKGPSEICSALESLQGILRVGYDNETHHFTISFDPHRLTILKILNAIEGLGRMQGLSLRPTDVEPIGWQHLEGPRALSLSSPSSHPLPS